MKAITSERRRAGYRNCEFSQPGGQRGSGCPGARTNFFSIRDRFLGTNGHQVLPLDWVRGRTNNGLGIAGRDYPVTDRPRRGISPPIGVWGFPGGIKVPDRNICRGPAVSVEVWGRRLPVYVAQELVDGDKKFSGFGAIDGTMVKRQRHRESSVVSSADS